MTFTVKDLINLKEGKTRFLIPSSAKQEVKGPYRARGSGVFYNPQMEISRDITIAVVEKYFNTNPKEKRNLKFLDGLAGTGVRGLRLANEADIPEGFSVTLNDGNPLAVDLITKNIERNNLGDRTTVLNENLNVILISSKFDFIDIDPFGSGVDFFDNAVRSSRPDGLLAVTSTDTAPLCGTYPQKCLRRYSADPLKVEYMHEIGLRILMGAYTRTAAKYDLSLEPILMYYMDYYFRIFLKVSKGSKKADESLRNLGYIAHDKKTNKRSIVNTPGKESKGQLVGPLWLGKLNDKDFVKTLASGLERFKSRVRIKKYCNLWYDESELPPWFYDINSLASYLKIQPKKFRDIKKILEGNGFLMVPTHFSPQGFKTNVDMDELRALLL